MILFSSLTGPSGHRLFLPTRFITCRLDNKRQLQEMLHGSKYWHTGKNTASSITAVIFWKRRHCLGLVSWSLLPIQGKKNQGSAYKASPAACDVLLHPEPYASKSPPSSSGARFYKPDFCTAITWGLGDTSVLPQAPSQPRRRATARRTTHQRSVSGNRRGEALGAGPLAARLSDPTPTAGPGEGREGGREGRKEGPGRPRRPGPPPARPRRGRSPSALPPPHTAPRGGGLRRDRRAAEARTFPLRGLPDTQHSGGSGEAAAGARDVCRNRAEAAGEAAQGGGGRGGAAPSAWAARGGLRAARRRLPPPPLRSVREEGGPWRGSRPGQRLPCLAAWSLGRGGGFRRRSGGRWPVVGGRRPVAGGAAPAPAPAEAPSEGRRPSSAGKRREQELSSGVSFRFCHLRLPEPDSFFGNSGKGRNKER